MPESQVLAPAAIKDRIQASLAALRGGPVAAGLEIYERDRVAFLDSADALGEPRLFSVGTVPLRYLTPLLWEGQVGGLIASDPFSGEVVSWPAWAPGPVPLFAFTMDSIDTMLARNDPRVHEFVPPQELTPHRFAVDPTRLESPYLLRRYDALPFKNQEERYSWVEKVNRDRRMRTRWRYKPGLQEPSYKCLSYAASTVVDWWGLTYGHPISSTYQNFVNGSQEYGTEPRHLEVLYYERARRNKKTYRMMPRLPATLDPVTRERIPNSSMAFAQLICSPEAAQHPDPLTRDGRPLYTYQPGMWHMDGPPRTLFTKGRADPALLREALHHHGIVLAFTQARLLRFIRFGLHGIPIVGYFRKGKETLFIYHESYGNHGPGYHWDNSGGPAYMSLPASLLREASCFPHRLWLDVSLAGADLALTATHSGGADLAIPSLHVALAAGDAIAVRSEAGSHRFEAPPRPCRIRIEAPCEYFYREDGHPHDAEIAWGGSAEPCVALTRWLLLQTQLEGSRSDYRPPHILARQSELEAGILALSRREDFKVEVLASLAPVLLDRELSLLQGTLLPRLVALGMDAGLVAVLSA